MGTDGTITSLLKALRQLKGDGVEHVSVDRLIDYLTNMEADSSQERVVPPAELERYKAQLAVGVQKQQEVSNINVEGFKSVILTGQTSLRSGLLINGGAALAVLAYIGKLSVEAPAHVSQFASPLLLFVMGTLTMAVTSGVTYLGQWFYFGGGTWKWKVGFWLNILAMILGFLSYVLFAWGSWDAYLAFKVYAEPNSPGS